MIFFASTCNYHGQFLSNLFLGSVALHITRKRVCCRIRVGGKLNEVLATISAPKYLCNQLAETCVGLPSKAEGLQKWLALSGADMHMVVACTIDVCILGQILHRQLILMMSSGGFRAQNGKFGCDICLFKQLGSSLCVGTFVTLSLK
jgi:hypothetical protein